MTVLNTDVCFFWRVMPHLLSVCLRLSKHEQVSHSLSLMICSSPLPSAILGIAGLPAIPHNTAVPCHKPITHHLGGKYKRMEVRHIEAFCDLESGRRRVTYDICKGSRQSEKYLDTRRKPSKGGKEGKGITVIIHYFCGHHM